METALAVLAIDEVVSGPARDQRVNAAGDLACAEQRGHAMSRSCSLVCVNAVAARDVK
jgi:hypothetical protein